jgi:hypothetical protein
MKGDQFSQVIVDHESGGIKKAEKITDADDCKNSGYRAVCVTPKHENHSDARLFSQDLQAQVYHRSRVADDIAACRKEQVDVFP